MALVQPLETEAAFVSGHELITLLSREELSIEVAIAKRLLEISKKIVNGSTGTCHNVRLRTLWWLWGEKHLKHALLRGAYRHYAFKWSAAVHYS